MGAIHHNEFVLTYVAPYSYYKTKTELSSEKRELAAYFLNTVVSFLTYAMRGGGSAKTLLSAFFQLFFKLYAPEIARLDRNSGVLALQVGLLLCVMELNQHGERQRLSLSILN
jgi:hypothetical protein